MSIELGPADWRRIALIEIDGELSSFGHVLGSPEPEYLVMLVEEPPPDRTWIEVFVDFGVGERRGARLAYAILSALELSVSSGILPPFRFVTGEQWLRHPPRLETGNPAPYEKPSWN